MGNDIPFRCEYTFQLASLPPLRVPPPTDSTVSYRDHLNDVLTNGRIMRLILDRASYIPVQYKFNTLGYAVMPELPMVTIRIDPASGEITMVSDKESPYQVVAFVVQMPP